MHTAKRLVATAVLLISSLAGSGDVWANLILNGGFETPVVTDSGGVEYRTGSQLTDWLITTPNNGVPQFNSTYQPVGGGLQSLQLEEPGDAITQSFATLIGQTYILEFDLSAFDTPGAGALTVEIDGIPTGGVFAGTSAAYVTHALLFVATGATTTLGFEHAGLFGVSFPHLDDVSVTAVPEPASLALLGVALAALGIARRRKKT